MHTKINWKVLCRPANLLTESRILLGIALLFPPVFSRQFYVLYLAAGSTDMIDGTVARKTGMVSRSGAVLDTIADLTLVIVCAVRMLPALVLPYWILLWIGLIALVKLTVILTGIIRFRRFPAVHTVLNKLTGAALFALPLTISILPLNITAAAVCLLATAAALQEAHLAGKDCRDH